MEESLRRVEVGLVVSFPLRFVVHSLALGRLDHRAEIPVPDLLLLRLDLVREGSPVGMTVRFGLGFDRSFLRFPSDSVPADLGFAPDSALGSVGLVVAAPDFAVAGAFR